MDKIFYFDVKSKYFSRSDVLGNGYPTLDVCLCLLMYISHKHKQECCEIVHVDGVLAHEHER